MKVTREGTILKGPGIGDDCRGLVVVLGVIKALNEAKVKTPGTITFVADMGEEGLGDLRGTKNLFADSLKGQIDKFISVDGTGPRYYECRRRQLSLSRRHSKVPAATVSARSAWPIRFRPWAGPSPKSTHFEVPTNPKTTFNVGRVGGGTSVNAIPFECWMEVDMRSSDKDSLEAVQHEIQSSRSGSRRGRE